MRIGLVDVDGHNGFPNFAIMKLSAWHKVQGDNVEWANPLFGEYDRVYESKVFTFTLPNLELYDCEVVKGGTGHSVKSRLPKEIEMSTTVDYSLYPQCNYSIQFFSRGCIRHCPFCLVHEKEGEVHSVEPCELNPKGEWIEVLDNNFFANPEWKYAVDYLIAKGQPINLHGVDVRIMNEEQAFWLNKLRLKHNIHIAWDLPHIDLTDKLREVVKYIKPYKLTCYVLVGFNSTIEEDLYRVERLRELKITPFVQPYRDFENKRKPTQYEMDFARWVNRQELFKSHKFKEYEPRKGFRCSEYFKK